jgi:SET domain-containing protein
VRGRTRIGIFAIKDIAFGEALSYDYQFDTNVRTPSRPALLLKSPLRSAVGR